MTDISDEHFLRKIQNSPDDELARGIYADWLEEQGSEKAELIHMFQEIVSSQENQGEPLLNELVGRIVLHVDGFSLPVEELLKLLSREDAFRAGVDFAWMIPGVRTYSNDESDQRRSRDLLITTWKCIDRQYSRQELDYDVEQYYDWVYSYRSVYYAARFFPGVAYRYAQDWVRTTRFTHGSDDLLLIAVSYYLFNTNVLSGAFIRSDLTY